jgi:hypothetical protein
MRVLRLELVGRRMRVQSDAHDSKLPVRGALLFHALPKPVEL